MPIQTAQTGDTIQYRNADGEKSDVLVTSHQRSAPGIPGSSTAVSGGTLAAATYSYRLSAVIGAIETQASTAKTQVTTGSTSTVTLDWTTIAASAPYNGATSFKVYGRTGGSELLMGTVTMPTKTFTDTGSVSPSGALPAATTAVSLTNRIPKQLLTTIAKATTLKGTNVYFKR